MLSLTNSNDADALTVRGLVEGMVRQTLGIPQINYDSHMAAWLGEQISIGDHFTGDGPVLYVKLTNRQAVQETLHRLVSDSGATTTSVSHQNYEIQTFNHQLIGYQSWMVLDDWLLIGTEDALRSAINTWNSAANLQTNDSFRDAFDNRQLQAGVTVYMGETAFDTFRQPLQNIPEPFGSLMSDLIPRQMAMGLGYDNGTLISGVLVEIDLLENNLVETTVNHEALADFLPEHTFWTLSFSEFDTAIAPGGSANLLEQIINTVDTEFSLVLAQPRQREVLQNDPFRQAIMWLGLPLDWEFGLVVQADNFAPTRELLESDAILAILQAETVSLDVSSEASPSITYYRLNGREQWTVYALYEDGERVVLGTSSFIQSLRNVQEGTLPSLRDTPQWQVISSYIEEGRVFAYLQVATFQQILAGFGEVAQLIGLTTVNTEIGSQALIISGSLNFDQEGRLTGWWAARIDRDMRRGVLDS